MSVAPDLETFRALCAKHPGRLIPVLRRFLADSLTPVAAFRRLVTADYGFLLESVERGERVGRYSFVGGEPDLIFSGNILPEPSHRISRPRLLPGATREGDPLAALEKHLAENPALAPDPSLGAPPFGGGAVGYLGYDIVRLFEPRLMKAPPDRHGIEGLPDVQAPVYRTLVAFDHVKNSVFVVHLADPREGSPEAAYRKAEEAIAAVARKLGEAVPEPLSEIATTEAPAPAARSNFEREEFLEAVAKAKEYIAAGDVIQVVLSQRFTRSTTAAPFEVYRSLRAINPSPYMFYLRTPTVHVVGSSPEVMVAAEEGTLTVRPIAGTRPRGKTPEEDAALASELLADEKERAEHVMLLDLGRNDVGRISEYGSVRVTERMTVENYSHVMHIVSNVAGKLQKGLGAFDVLRACHPAGTVSGAPKIRAMEIIDELEPESRGPYAGAVGVIDFRGNVNTAIAIRTIFMCPFEDGHYEAHVQAGAGLVADSVPEREYEETVNKARALFRAIEAAEARSGAGK